MIEARTEYNKLIRINSIKELDCMTNIMVILMTLYESEGAKTRRYFIESSGTKDNEQLKIWVSFYIHTSIGQPQEWETCANLLRYDTGDQVLA